MSRTNYKIVGIFLSFVGIVALAFVGLIPKAANPRDTSSQKSVAFVGTVNLRALAEGIYFDEFNDPQIFDSYGLLYTFNNATRSNLWLGGEGLNLFYWQFSDGFARSTTSEGFFKRNGLTVSIGEVYDARLFCREEMCALIARDNKLHFVDMTVPAIEENRDLFVSENWSAIVPLNFKEREYIFFEPDSNQSRIYIAKGGKSVFLGEVEGTTLEAKVNRKNLSIATTEGWFSLQIDPVLGPKSHAVGKFDRVRLSEDGKFFASYDFNEFVRVWSVSRDGPSEFKLPTDQPITTVRFSETEEKLFVLVASMSKATIYSIDLSPL